MSVTRSKTPKPRILIPEYGFVGESIEIGINGLPIIRNGSYFCGNCGHQLALFDGVCPACGTDVDPTFTYKPEWKEIEN